MDRSKQGNTAVGLQRRELEKLVREVLQLFSASADVEYTLGNGHCISVGMLDSGI